MVCVDVDALEYPILDTRKSYPGLGARREEASLGLSPGSECPLQIGVGVNGVRSYLKDQRSAYQRAWLEGLRMRLEG